MFEFDDLTAWTLQEVVDGPAMDYMEFCELDNTFLFDIKIKEGCTGDLWRFQCTTHYNTNEKISKKLNQEIPLVINCMMRKFHKGPCLSYHPVHGPMNVAGPYILP